jgi:ribosomal protein L37E
MTTKRGDIAGKWHTWCADCGAKNHINADECSVCGYSNGDEPFGVNDYNNVGKPEYTSDGTCGIGERT